jgi:hypothetical protein
MSSQGIGAGEPESAEAGKPESSGTSQLVRAGVDYGEVLDRLGSLLGHSEMDRIRSAIERPDKWMSIALFVGALVLFVVAFLFRAVDLLLPGEFIAVLILATVLAVLPWLVAVYLLRSDDRSRSERARPEAEHDAAVRAAGSTESRRDVGLGKPRGSPRREPPDV